MLKNWRLTISLCVLVMAAMAGVSQAGPPKEPKEGPPDASYTDQIIIETSVPADELIDDGKKDKKDKKAKKEQKERDWSAAAGIPVKVKRHMLDGKVVLKLPGRMKLVAVRRIAENLLTDPTVLSAEEDVEVTPEPIVVSPEDVEVTPEYTPNDPAYPLQWHYKGPPQEPGGANLPLAWNLATGANVVVAVLDTGIAAQEDFTAGRILNNSYDFYDRDGDVTDPNNVCSWHGNHVTGTIAAATNNNKGVAGIAREATILPVRVMGPSYTSSPYCKGNLSDVVDAMLWAVGLPILNTNLPTPPPVPQPAKVFNLSFGAQSTCVTYLQKAIDDVVATGAVVIVAAGNAGYPVQYYLPASCNNVITVAAHGKTGDRASFSNFGQQIEVSAPGISVYSTLDGANYGYKNGTSMATPHVTGVAALLKSYDQTLTPAAITQAIVNSARPFPAGATCAPGGSYAGLCGAGLLDGYVALGANPITDQPPQAVINAPANNSVFFADQPISFAGSATDYEDGDLAAYLEWRSDVDGFLYKGRDFEKTLSIGAHTISAAVADSHGQSTMATIRVTVKAPEDTFTSTGAQDGWVLESGQGTGVGGSIKSNDTSSKGLLLGDDKNNRQYKSILSFDTSSIPDKATIVSARVRIQRGTISGTSPFNTHGDLWADIRTGGFNNNAALETADFQAPATASNVVTGGLTGAASNNDWSEGELNGAGMAAINKTGVTQLRLYFNLPHNNDKGIDYLGYYPGDYSATASRPQLVVGYIVNDPPAVTISAPADGESFLEGEPILFVGSASDPEDGDLTSVITWYDDIDGQLGTNEASINRTLSPGTHTITATAVDSDGAVGSDTITIRVRNSWPTVEITAPTDDARFYENQTISFSGWADDLEDGILTGAIQWTSDLDGLIGSGGSFSRALSLGTHVITASVTDDDKNTSDDTVTVTVSVSPPVTVTLNSVGTHDGWVLESGESTDLGGSIKASDTSSKGLLLGDDKNNKQYKSVLSFDTSQIPASATIESATLRILRGTVSGTSPFDTHGALLVDIRTGGFNGNVALEKGDFQAPATATAVASLSKAASNGAWSEGDLDENGLAAIDTMGVTQFRLYFELDDNNDKGDDYLGYYPGDNATAANRPQLVVTYRQ